MPNAHTLTLKFHRFLSQEEWRIVIEAAKQLPYVRELEAQAVIEPHGNPLQHELLDLITLMPDAQTQEIIDYIMQLREARKP